MSCDSFKNRSAGSQTLGWWAGAGGGQQPAVAEPATSFAGFIAKSKARGHLFKYYQEFQGGDRRALNQTWGPSKSTLTGTLRPIHSTFINGVISVKWDQLGWAICATTLHRGSVNSELWNIPDRGMGGNRQRTSRGKVLGVWRPHHGESGPAVISASEWGDGGKQSVKKHRCWFSYTCKP